MTESKLGSRPAKTSTPSRSGSIAESLSPSGSSDLESDDDSAYYSESDIENEPEELSPLPPSRPADPNKAVEYDVIKAVWAKKNVGLSGTVIRTALAEYWGIFKGIRDKWKAKATSLQQFIEKKDQANIKAYERRVYEQRRLLESCISLTLKHGHPNIIEKYVQISFPLPPPWSWVIPSLFSYSTGNPVRVAGSASWKYDLAKEAQLQGSCSIKQGPSSWSPSRAVGPVTGHESMSCIKYIFT